MCRGTGLRAMDRCTHFLFLCTRCRLLWWLAHLGVLQRQRWGQSGQWHDTETKNWTTHDVWHVWPTSKISTKLISYCADKLNNSPMPCPSNFAHPLLTLHHHIQPAPSKSKTTPLLLSLPHTTTLDGQWLRRPRPHPQHLRLGGHSSLSCANEFDTTIIWQQMWHCNDDYNTTMMNVTLWWWLWHHNDNCNTATTNVTLQWWMWHCKDATAMVKQQWWQ